MTPLDLLPSIHEACLVMDKRLRSPLADRMLVAVALQESGLRHRCQVGDGGLYLQTLARGWWGFERGGGVVGVMIHDKTARMASVLCQHCRVFFDDDSIHDAIAWQDVLAAGFARLLLYTVPAALPRTEGEAWQQYLDAWRPGKPRPETWPGHWQTATELCL